MSRGSSYGRKVSKISDRISEFKLKLLWWGNITLVIYGIKHEDRSRRTRLEPLAISNDGLWLYNIYSSYRNELNLNTDENMMQFSNKLKIIGFDIV